mmetsp:Transcript_70151/g.195175  ORF Transcript_70151/g.195175 Transcript_70151/m.195175 type:complete len:123 (+) Transcript_70151:101-469(+)
MLHGANSHMAKTTKKLANGSQVEDATSLTPTCHNFGMSKTRLETVYGQLPRVRCIIELRMTLNLFHDHIDVARCRGYSLSELFHHGCDVAVMFAMRCRGCKTFASGAMPSEIKFVEKLFFML